MCERSIGSVVDEISRQMGEDPEFAAQVSTHLKSFDPTNGRAIRNLFDSAPELYEEWLRDDWPPLARCGASLLVIAAALEGGLDWVDLGRAIRLLTESSEALSPEARLALADYLTCGIEREPFDESSFHCAMGRVLLLGSVFQSSIEGAISTLEPLANDLRAAGALSPITAPWKLAESRTLGGAGGLDMLLRQLRETLRE